jgi:predicted ATPase
VRRLEDGHEPFRPVGHQPASPPPWACTVLPTLPPMLRSIRLRNFKSFADAEAPLGPLTLLVGANASGKSNLLEALRFLNGVVTTTLPIDQILQGGFAWQRAAWPGIRGGVHEAIRNGAEAFTVETSCRALSNEELRYAISCSVAPSPRVLSESLRRTSAAAPVFEVRKGSPGLPGESMLMWTGESGAPRSAQFDERRTMLGRQMQLSDLGEADRDLLEHMRGVLSRMTLLDLLPAAMRAYVPQEMWELGDSGENLSAVLFRLCEDPERKQGLVDWLVELCAPELADLDFSTTDEGEVMVRLVEKDGIRVSARSLSDSTLRFLGEIVALRTAPEGSTLLMEELGNGLHPRRMHLLVEYLEAITEERDLQVIATTHSPLVLQALGPEARADAIVLGRVPERPGTVMRRLGDLPGFDEIVERRGIEYLYTTGWLEQAL